MSPLNQRAFSIELPFEFFFYNDEEDFEQYVNWEVGRQEWLKEFCNPLVTHEIQGGTFKVYDGDVDEWFEWKDGYKTEGRYKDGEKGFTLKWIVFVKKREPVIVTGLVHKVLDAVDKYNEKVGK